MQKKRKIFHIDVNNAFLSWSAVKMLEEGSSVDIRTIPSVIGGDESKRHGIVLAKSPIAKKYGIKTAETLYAARKKCPNLKIFSADYEYYHKKSQELFNYLSMFTPEMETFSIDEGFLDLTGTNYLYSDLLSLAYKMRDEIYEKYGFTVNIGIANNKLCAKMATDFEKPNKVHTLYQEEIKKKMWPLKVSKLFMIGKKTSEKLESLGIKTIGDLATSDVSFLQKYFKNQAVLMWEYANGIDESKVQSNREGNKCMSMSETFEIDIDDIERLKATLKNQVEQTSRSLRKKSLFAKTVAITIKTYDFKSFSKQKRLENATNISKDIYAVVLALLNDVWDGTKIRNIGVRLTNFTSLQNRQLSLLEPYQDQEQPIDAVIDQIKDQFGNEALVFANALEKKREVVKEGD